MIEDAQLVELLRPLAGIEPVRRGRAKRSARPALVVAIVLLVLAAVGIAAAEGIGPFAGIGAADRPATPNDVLDPAMREAVARVNANAFENAGQLLVDSARLVDTLPSGRRIYVVATTTNSLCVLIQEAPGTARDSAIGCGSPLSQTQPTTEETIRVNQQTPPLSFGVARDGVTSVSFRAGGVETTIPVTNNVWAYEGESNILESLTVHFADGTETTLGR
jgi:hypothetical protein